MYHIREKKIFPKKITRDKQRINNLLSHKLFQDASFYYHASKGEFAADLFGYLVFKTQNTSGLKDKLSKILVLLEGIKSMEYKKKVMKDINRIKRISNIKQAGWADWMEQLG